MNQVEENLYLTNYYFAKRLDLLQENGITHILVIGRELLPWHPEVRENFKQLML